MNIFSKEKMLNKLLVDRDYQKFLKEIGAPVELVSNPSLTNIITQLRLDDVCKNDDWELNVMDDKNILRREELNLNDGRRAICSISFGGGDIKISEFVSSRNDYILHSVGETEICVDRYGYILILIRNASYDNNGDIYYNFNCYKYSRDGSLILDVFYCFKENKLFLSGKDNILEKFKSRYKRLNFSLDSMKLNNFFIPKCSDLNLSGLCGRSIMRISDRISFGCLLNNDRELVEKYMPVFEGDNLGTLYSNYQYDTLDELLADNFVIREKIKRRI